MNNVMNAQLCYKILIRFMRPRVILYSVISNQSWILMTLYGKGVLRKSNFMLSGRFCKNHRSWIP